jgi:hypothetical protein
MQSILKPLAFVCKIIAVFIWLSGVWSEVLGLYAPRDGLGHLASASLLSLYAEICGILVVALVAVIPNRWLVSSPYVFTASLVIAVVPMFFAIYHWVADITFIRAFSHPILMAFFSLAFMIIDMVIVYIPLPLSLIASFWRGRMGQQVTYA